MAVLEIKGIKKKFGELVALNNLDISINEGEIVGLVGPNGSGKTTLINIISGFLRPTAGSIIYNGQSIEGMEPHQIARKGIVRTFQLTSLFFNLTVEENLIVSRDLKRRYTYWGSYLRSIFHTRGYCEEESELSRKADEILSIVEMKSKRDVIVGNLPTVEQRKLEIAIALATGGNLLLLDEPAAGMNPTEVKNLIHLLQSINQFGIALLVIEHNMRVIMEMCTKIVVLNYGIKIAEGTQEEVINNKEVISSYLGEELENAQG